VLQALADPVRRQIIAQLAHAPNDLMCSAIKLSVSAATATHHFTVLRQTGILHQYYIGTARLNAIRHDDLDAALPGLIDPLIAAVAAEQPKKTAKAPRSRRSH
jgi:DNA-binding transcriptional ArsR family regulator